MTMTNHLTIILSLVSSPSQASNLNFLYVSDARFQSSALASFFPSLLFFCHLDTPPATQHVQTQSPCLPSLFSPSRVRRVLAPSHPGSQMEMPPALPSCPWPFHAQLVTPLPRQPTCPLPSRCPCQPTGLPSTPLPLQFILRVEGQCAHGWFWSALVRTFSSGPNGKVQIQAHVQVWMDMSSLSHPIFLTLFPKIPFMVLGRCFSQ